MSYKLLQGYKNKNKIKEVQIVNILNSLILVLVQWIYRFRLLAFIGMDSWFSNKLYQMVYFISQCLYLYGNVMAMHVCFICLFRVVIVYWNTNLLWNTINVITIDFLLFFKTYFCHNITFGEKVTSLKSTNT